MPAAPKTYLSIQWLRAVAALMVVGYHLRVPLGRGGSPLAIPEWLDGGVDIFFVVSGFIMWATTAGRDMTPREFYVKRLVRIVPLYWLLTAATVIGLLAAPSLFQSAKFDLQHVIASFLFWPWPHPVLGDLQPVLVPGWTLNYEMFFYLLFGAGLLLPEARRIPALCALLVATVGFGLFATRGTALAFYGWSIVIEFALGLLVARMLVGAPTSPRRGAMSGTLALAAGFIGLAVVADLPPPAWRGLSYGIPAALVVWGAVTIEASGALRLRLPLLHRLGDASYAIYLSHGIVLSACGQLWRRLAPAHGWAIDGLFCVIAATLACLVGLAIHRWIEAPMAAALTAPVAKRPTGGRIPA